jgi:ABC-type sugar transport system substrate-binding protein
VDALRKYLDPGIKVVEVNTDINNSQFALAVVEVLKESLKS